MVFKRVYNGTDKKKLRKIMKVVVIQQLVGKGYLIHDNIERFSTKSNRERNIGHRNTQAVMKKCM